jgi:hypothetical protein
LYLDAKNHAKPSLHRDSFLAPLTRGIGILPGACVGLRLLKHTAGPLAKMELKNWHRTLFELTINLLLDNAVAQLISNKILPENSLRIA